MDKTLITLAICGGIYLLLRNQSATTEDQIYSTDGYLPPQADPTTTTPTKSNPTKPTTTTKPATSTTPATTTTTPPLVVKRVLCKANQKVNIRDYFNPNKIVRQAYVGELIGTYLTQKELTINNQKSVFVEIQGGDILPGVYNYYYVLKAAIDFVY